MSKQNICPIIYDEAGDIRLLNESERKRLSETFDKIKSSIGKTSGAIIMWGTPEKTRDNDNKGRY